MIFRESLLYLAVNAFWIYILVRFTHMFFEEAKVEKRTGFLICFLFYIVNSLGNLLFHSPLINACITVLAIFAITLCYKSGMMKRIMAALLIYAICIVCDIAAIALLGQYGESVRGEIIHSVVTYLLIFMAELLLEHSVQLQYDFQIYRRYLLELITIPLCSLIIICMIVYNNAGGQNITVFVAVLLLAMNIGVFYLYDSVLKNYREKYKNTVLEQQLHVYCNQLDTVIQTQDKINGLKHDMKHHLLTLENMMKASPGQESQAYLKSMLGSMDNPKEHANTGNRDIDSALNYFIQRAEDGGIEVNTKLNIPAQIEINFFELNVMLSNLLENAITAAGQSQEKIISLKMELDREVLYINIENSYTGKIQEINGNLQTSKQDSNGHGYGLKNVKIMVEKNNGILEIDYNEKVFTVGILLYRVI